MRDRETDRERLDRDSVCDDAYEQPRGLALGHSFTTAT